MGKLFNQALKRDFGRKTIMEMLKQLKILSGDALQLLIIIASFDEGINIDWTEFEKHYKIGRRRRVRALQELAANGLFFMNPVHGGAAKLVYEFYFWGKPLSPEEFEEFKLRI